MIRCPVHDMHDCSPLLNGCSLVNDIHRLVEAEVDQRLAHFDTFTTRCTKVGRRAGTYYSTWREVNAEGIVTEVTFRYPGASSTGDKVGDEITLSLHLDENGDAISRPTDMVSA